MNTAARPSLRPIRRDLLCLWPLVWWARSSDRDVIDIASHYQGMLSEESRKVLRKLGIAAPPQPWRSKRRE